MKRRFNSVEVAATTLVAGFFALSACNAISGADDIIIGSIDGEEYQDNQTTGGQGAGDTTGATGETDTGSSSSSSTSSGNGSSSSTSSGNGSSSSSASSSGTTTSTEPQPCQYPAGPYGVKVGQTVPPTHSWQGYAENSSQASTISIQDYFDCDGSKGIHALMLETSQFGCPACDAEASGLEKHMQDWKGQNLGIRWITLMLDDQYGDSPTTKGAKLWKDNWGLDSVAVCADPSYSMVPGNSVGTPQTTIVDPRTMKVLSIQEGYSGNYSKLTSLAQSNK